MATYTSPPRASAYGYGATQSPYTKHRYGVSADYTYTSPKAYASPRYTNSGHYFTRTEYQSPSGGVEYVSAKYYTQPDYHSHGKSKSTPRHRRQSEPYRASHGDSDGDEYIYHEDGFVEYIPASRHSKGETYYIYRGSGTNHRQQQDDPKVRYYMPSEPLRYETTTPKPRRSSHSTPKRPSTAKRPSSSHKKAAPPKTRTATEADARKHSIPPGYSLKNWDPDEDPLTLLGSVFDGNSLGKWIYDWTVYRHDAGTPIADMAGELWLLLIALSGKVKRAEECVPRIRTQANLEMVEDFIESGERLTDKLQRLLKACETPMLKASRRSGKEQAQLGKNAGVEFVDSIFGRDRQLENTEKLMASIRLWSMRFDANCESILRRPTQ